MISKPLQPASRDQLRLLSLSREFSLHFPCTMIPNQRRAFNQSQLLENASHLGRNECSDTLEHISTESILNMIGGVWPV